MHRARRDRGATATRALSQSAGIDVELRSDVEERR
jgi:hypothetical protein